MARHDGHGPRGLYLHPAFVDQLVAELPDSAIPGHMREAHTWSASRDLKAIALMRHGRALIGLPRALPSAGSRQRTSVNRAKPSAADLELAGMCFSNTVLTSEKWFLMQQREMVKLQTVMAAAGKVHAMHEHVVMLFLMLLSGQLVEASLEFEEAEAGVARWGTDASEACFIYPPDERSAFQTGPSPKLC